MNPVEEQQVSLQDDIGAAFDEQNEEIIKEPEEAPEEIEALEPLAPVDRWGRELKDTFNEWSEMENGRAYQQALLDYHKEQQGYHTKLEQDIAPLRSESETWNGVFQPYQDFLMHNGLTPQEAARRGVGVMSNIAQDPQAFALDILKRSNYDFSSHGQEQTYIPPEVKALQDKLDRIEQAQQGNALQAQQHEANQLNQQIQSFVSATDESGNLLHPHYQAVEEQMVMAVYGYKGAGKPVPALDQLYEQACKQNGDIQAQVKAEESAKEAARKAAKAKKAKQAAQRSDGSHTGTESASNSLKDDIEAEYDKQAAA